MKHNPLEAKLFAVFNPIAIKSGINVTVFTNQNGIEPNEDYLAININSATIDNATEVIFEDYEVEPEKKRLIETAIYRGVIDIQLRVIGTGGTMAIMESIKARLKMSGAADVLFGNKMGIHSVQNSINTGFLEGGKSRDRTDCKVLLHYTMTYTDIIQSIGTVTVNGYDVVTDSKIVGKTITESG